jgi:hypothetical protein
MLVEDAALTVAVLAGLAQAIHALVLQKSHLAVRRPVSAV